MRRALWILSTPVVAGGLAWAVNAADDQAPLLARAPSAQNGKIFYFSRGAKPGAEAAAAAANRESDAAEAESDEAASPRYTRNRSGSQATAARGAGSKNYQDLFGEGQGEVKQASARKPALPAGRAARTARRPVEDRLVSEASPDSSEVGGEENPLPPTSDTVELAQATDEQDAGVRHADHKAQPGTSRRQVQHVQHTTRGAASTRPSKPLAESSDSLDSALDADEALAPPPAATAKPRVTTAKQTAPKAAPGRPAAKPVVKPAVAAQAKPTKPAAKPKAEKKIEQASAVVEETPAETIDEAPVSRATIQQVSVGASDASEVPMVSLKWVKKGEVNVGQECKCGLQVKNTGKLAAKDIVVEAHFPRTVRLLDAEPFPSDSKDKLTWVFDHLDAGEEKTIEITMIPGRRGELATSATVRFTGVASTVLKVEEPQLAVAIDGSQDVLVGESTVQTITVSNPGTGIAHDVVVHVTIPDGLENPKGKSVEMGIGSLGPSEKREIRLPLSATAGGKGILLVEARGANLVQKTQCEITIAAPKLKVEVAGPGLRYIGRHAQFTINVSNDGIAGTDNVRIVHLIPEGFEFVDADRGGKFDAQTGSVSWFVGRVDAGQNVQVACNLNAKRIGDYQHHVQASGENGSIAAARLDTKVDGTSSVVMEVADIDDPIEIETQTAYEIKIRNDGSKAAQNLRLVCELPQGVELLGTEGPTEYTVDKGSLHFRPLAEIAAGGKATYRIKVNGKVAGNLRLRAKLTSNASTEPLIVEELTRFYAD